ncbi:hypothetical protein DRJ19_00030 [Candidatus Woesearchaeota archaeon]|nr:MAG: hypothetical protein DRJ19_00030 [Candidatus Woesearchaeota archaeon]
MRREGMLQHLLYLLSRSRLGGPVRGLLNCVVPKQPVVVPLFPPLLGHRMWLDLQSQKAYWLGIYEREVCKALLSRVKRGWTVADVGAHIGYFTLLLAKLVGPSGRVFAFEPCPANFQVLSANVALNGYRWVTLEQKAVTNCDGRIILNAPRQRYPSQVSIVQQGGETIEVEATSLDAYWEAMGNPPLHLVKMDIEGAEDAALEGMKWLLHQQRPIVVVEIHASDDGTESKALCLLKDAGYSLRSLDRKGWPKVNPTCRGHILGEP